MLGSNPPQREWLHGSHEHTARPTIGRTGGVIVTSPDRLPLDHALTVGRQAMPGQVLDRPNVSRRHAAFEGGRWKDLVARSRWGQWYLRQRRAVARRSFLSLGGSRFLRLTFDGTALTRVWRVGNVELLVRGVSYDVPGGVTQRIVLRDVSLRQRLRKLPR